jgi:dCTP diphosphatase
MGSLLQLQTAFQKFVQDRDWEQFHNPKNLTMALSVEVAELMELFQWLTPDESQKAMDSPQLNPRIQEEVADVFLYLVRLADVLGIDLIQAAQHKMLRNAEKYPIELSRGTAKKYTDLHE